MENILSLAQHYLLPFLVVLGVVVFFHEFGHYIVARLCGVKIEAFSIGFGREIFGWKDKHGTRWKVSWLPLGGYVKMYGDAGPASTPDASLKEMTPAQKKVSYFYQNVEKRLAIAAAGPIANFLLAIVMLALLFTFHGQSFTKPVVSGLMDDGAAAAAGVKTGDVIASIDGKKIEWFEDIVHAIALNTGTPMSIGITRGHEHLMLTVTPKVTTVNIMGMEAKIGRIGIKGDQVEYKKDPPLIAVYQATLETWNMAGEMLKGIGQMVIGLRGADELGGPIRIVQMSGNIAKEGPVSLLHWAAFISINLGLINLFPIPLLDGGHLLFYGIEWLRGRPLKEKTQELGFRAGLVFIVCLMLFVTWNDLVHLLHELTL
jgi:regulator of sigma E protease